MRYVAKEVNGKGYIYNTEFSMEAPIAVDETIEEAKETAKRWNEEDIYDKAEAMAEEAICNKGCLCPSIKESSGCCSCEVFMALRNYYADEMIEEMGEREQ